MVNKSNDYLAPHYVQRSNWLRAAVLGANDGILSTASLAIGIAAASNAKRTNSYSNCGRFSCRSFINGCRRICFCYLN